MSGFLTSVAILGTIAFTLGASADPKSDGGPFFLRSGALLIVIAGIGGLINAFS